MDKRPILSRMLFTSIGAFVVAVFHGAYLKLSVFEMFISFALMWIVLNQYVQMRLINKKRGEK